MKKKRLYIVFILSIVLGQSVFAEVRLPALISNGMILQRDIRLKIWGWASAGEKISLLFSSNKDKAYHTTANEKGEWFILLPKQKAGGPYYMKIEAGNHLVIENILVGDVWLCSGQSNMEQGMGARLKYKYADEIATVNNSNIRHFLVPDNIISTNHKRMLKADHGKKRIPKISQSSRPLDIFLPKNCMQNIKCLLG